MDNRVDKSIIMTPQPHIVVARTSEKIEEVVHRLPANETRTASQAGATGEERHLTNTDRAKTITLVLEKILAKTDFPHGGINE